MTSLWHFYCWLWTYLTAFSSVSIVDFKQVNVSWEAACVYWRFFQLGSNNLHLLKCFVSPLKSLSMNNSYCRIEREETLKYHCVYKFNIVSNDHGRTQNWELTFLSTFGPEILLPTPLWICGIQWWCSLFSGTFSFLEWKYPFWENQVQKIKIVSFMAIFFQKSRLLKLKFWT